MFSRPKILFLVSLLFVALLNSIPTYLLNFEFFYHSILLKNGIDSRVNTISRCVLRDARYSLRKISGRVLRGCIKFLSGMHKFMYL